MKVAIIGGGIAGLAAAFQLTRRSAEVTLYEASSRFGGTIGTVHEQGFTMELGPDAWVTEKPWARQLAEDLGLAAEIIPSLDAGRKTWILQSDKLVALPDGMRMMVPADLDAMRASPLFTAEAKAACEAEPLRAAELKAAAPVHDESIACFVRRHFGGEMLRKVGAPLLSGVFGGDVEQLSARAIMPQFVAMEREYGSLIAALQAKAATAQPIFSTLRNGMGSLVDALVAAIPSPWLRLNTPVSSIAREKTCWLVDGERYEALLLATPAHVTECLLRPIDHRIADLLRMETSSAVAVNLAFAEYFDLPTGFGFLAPADEGSQLLACTFVDQKFPYRARSHARLLRAFLSGDHWLRLGDAELIALAHQELSAILGPLPQPAVTAVSRLPRSLPQYAVGHLDRIAELNERILTLPGLTLLGSTYRGVGVPDIIRDARTAAENL